jgi:hypothetical protein
MLDVNRTSPGNRLLQKSTDLVVEITGTILGKLIWTALSSATGTHFRDKRTDSIQLQNRKTNTLPSKGVFCGGHIPLAMLLQANHESLEARRTCFPPGDSKCQVICIFNSVSTALPSQWYDLFISPAPQSHLPVSNPS